MSDDIDQRIEDARAVLARLYCEKRGHPPANVTGGDGPIYCLCRDWVWLKHRAIMADAGIPLDYAESAE